MTVQAQSKPVAVQALIIGGGVTGTGIARDLSLRGVSCLLVEKGDINAGASGANHGLLHSGARYVASDPEAAVECRVEGRRLRSLAPHCIDDAGGLFVAVAGDDEAFVAGFPGRCRACGIPVSAVDPRDALEMEPALSPRIIAAFQVPDAAINPFKLSLDNMEDARRHGARMMRYTRVTGFRVADRRIREAQLRDEVSGAQIRVEPDQVISASGAWAAEIARMAGIAVPIICSKGSLLVTQNRICQRVINRLRPPADADILVPGGTVSIIGTTSVRIAAADLARPSITEVDHIIEEAAAMVPELEHTRYIRAYAGVRPLIGCPSASGPGDRAVSRGVALIDHARDGVDNLTTITGGKLTTFRLMAEKTADQVCARLGVAASGQTGHLRLPASDPGRWTEPALGPRHWLRHVGGRDTLLCECEMVSHTAVDEIVRDIRERGGAPSLKAIGLRSRIGKGPCQGTFCSARVTAHLYNTGVLDADAGAFEIRDFLEERWRGEQPLLWDLPLMQAELKDALHCGLLCLEMERDP